MRSPSSRRRPTSCSSRPRSRAPSGPACAVTSRRPRRAPRLAPPGAKRVVLIHISDELDWEWARDEAAEAFGGPVEVAKHGDVYEV